MPSEAAPLRALVVGGSLVGLSSAIALARSGVSVTVLERTASSGYEGGGGLGVDVDLLAAVTGLSDRPPVYRGSDRDTTAWPLLAGWLESRSGRSRGSRWCEARRWWSSAMGGLAPARGTSTRRT
ncbi:MAG: NAD-binding protein [Solirubrobacteraceae bacterium]